MTASEPSTTWGADSRVDDAVVCRVGEGRDFFYKVADIIIKYYGNYR